MHDNAAHQYFFAAARIVGGKATEAAPQYRTTKLSHDIEELIAEGIRSLDCEHEAKVAAGQSYCFRTYKCQLEELHDPKLFFD